MELFTLAQALDYATSKLDHLYTRQAAQRHAWWLVRWATGYTDAQLITRKHERIKHEAQEKLVQALYEHTAHHKPLQYSIGSVPFLDVVVAVEPPVLIPRPETEEWCARLIEQLKPLAAEPLTILDMCTGSGCIGLALARALPQSTVWAADSNAQACTLAVHNAELNTITNFHVVLSNLFTNIPESLSLDIVVSNPPYMSFEAWQELEPSVKQWEDPQALWAEQQGDALTLQLITQARKRLVPRPLLQKHTIPQLVIEIDSTQGTRIQQAMESAGFSKVQLYTDFAGRDRVVTGELLL